MKYTIILPLFLIVFTSKAQQIKDTLYFKYDKKYINTYKEIPLHFYLDDSSGAKDGTFFFEQIEIKNNIKAKKKICIKKYVRNSLFFDKRKKRKLNDNKLFDHFSNYIIFLVKKENNITKYIKVSAAYEIQ